ncbi:hypothetical protein XCR_3182 [Xanthomonas campestris pv. raphani 756C]|nr:hypothetical protein XCR_3182 [Xanthomonas campestris pv. raphani 756C]
MVISGPQRDLLRYNRSCSQGSKATQKCRPRRCAIIRQVEVFSQPASAGAA